MSKPAKNEAALLKRAGEAIRKALIKPPGCTESTGCAVGPCHCAHLAAEAALAEIRAAGWAVVPVEPPAKDEAELMERVAKALYDNYDLDLPMSFTLTAIRKAGWAVVPVALMEEAAEELEEMNDSHYHHREKYPEEQRRYERDMELPNAIRAALEVKP